jgi:murein L,D-transpeptidase YcbB/YkuD
MIDTRMMFWTFIFLIQSSYAYCHLNFKINTVSYFDSVLFKKKLFQFGKKNLEKDILDFYRIRNYAPIWLEEMSLSRLMLWREVFLRTEEHDALKLPQFPLDRFLLLFNKKPQWNQADSTELELAATICFLQYGAICWNGLPAYQIKQTGWNRTAKRWSNMQMLGWLISKSNLISNPPVFHQYGLLKKKLAEYKLLYEQSNVPILPEQKKYPAYGDTGLFVNKLIDYLSQMRLLSDGVSNRLDSSVIFAIMKIQSQFGLEANGKLSRDLIRMMNVPLSQRIQQIIVNMERCRWIREEDEPLKIVVNIPDFRYYLIQNQKRIWVRKIIVGKEYQPTAVFNGRMQFIVFCPYWNIPPGILKNEILPLVHRNPGYLAAHHMEWHGSGIRQLPGPDNPLGHIKFLFPNRFNMYMHDTPGKHLFKQNKRTFSHGCMRIENARELAVFILNREAGWSEEKINRTIQYGKEKIVVLKNSIPVNITYLTSWVDEFDDIQFRNDVYGYDKKLMQLLKQ